MCPSLNMFTGWHRSMVNVPSSLYTGFAPSFITNRQIHIFYWRGWKKASCMNWVIHSALSIAEIGVAPCILQPGLRIWILNNLNFVPPVLSFLNGILSKTFQRSCHKCRMFRQIVYFFGSCINWKINDGLTLNISTAKHSMSKYSAIFPKGLKSFPNGLMGVNL